MGNLSSLRSFSGSIVVSALLGWSPSQVSAGNLAWLTWLGPLSCGLSSFSRLVPVLFTCWVRSSKSSKRAGPMHEHFASLCLHLICYHLIYQSESHGQVQGQYEKESPCDMDTNWLNSLGTIAATVYHTAVSSFPSLPDFLERSYIAMNNWASPSLHWGISVFPQNSVNSISLALYKALASFSDAVLPPPWDGLALMNWKIVLSQGFSDFLMVCMQLLLVSFPCRNAYVCFESRHWSFLLGKEF